MSLKHCWSNQGIESDVVCVLFDYNLFLSNSNFAQDDQNQKENKGWEGLMIKKRRQRKISVWARGVRIKRGGGKEGGCIWVGFRDIARVGGFKGGKKKRQTPASFFVPASPRCSLLSGGLEDTDWPLPTLCITPSLLSAIVPIPVSPDLLHSPLHMDKWLGLVWPKWPTVQREVWEIINRTTPGFEY